MATSQKKGSSTKKNTAKKSSGSRSRANSTAKKTAKTARGAAKTGNSKQVGAIALFAVALFLLFVALIPGGNVWLALQNVLFGLFGVIAYVLPFLLIYVAIITSLDRDTENLRPKIAEAVILIVFICAAVYVFSGDGQTGEFVNDVKLAFFAGKDMPHGGAVGAILGWPLLALFGGKVPAGITLIILIFVVLMIMSGTTLAKLLESIKNPVEKAHVATNEHFEERQLAREERRLQREEELEARRKEREKFNPDVDLGPKPGAKNTRAKSANSDEELSKGAALRKSIANKIYAFSDDPLLTEEEELPVPEVAETVSFNKNGKGRKKAEPEVEEPVKEAPAAKSVDDIIEQATAAKPAKPKTAAIDDTPFDVDAARDTVKELEDASASATRKEAYKMPPLDCLNPPSQSHGAGSKEELKENADKLVEVLGSFNVKTSLVGISRGPSVTRYELAPAAGVKISKITGLADDIALNLAASGVRIAPIAGKTAVGIEVPNRARDTVTLREVLESRAYLKGAAKSKLNVALGKDISGNTCVTDLAKMPHLLIAGTTGSGKSVCVNAMILSILYNATPDEVKLVMIDPKKVEFSVYNGIPHLLVPVVTEPAKAAGALQWAVREMNNRYKRFSENNVRDIRGYNELAAMDSDLEVMPQIVIFIDELADLMMATPKEVEDSICRLAQMARAAGMHLVIATQRPSVDVITGLIKANIPSRLSLSVSSAVDSRTILDMAGAEKLLGNGDMLFNPIGTSKPIRIQGCFSTDTEVENVVNFIKQQETTEYDESIIKDIEASAAAAENANNKNSGGVNAPGGEGGTDDLFEQAVQVVVEAGQASTSMLQRKLGVGYARAGRLIDELEQQGIIGEYQGSKPRAVLITRQQWLERNALTGDADEGAAAAIELGLDN